MSLPGATTRHTSQNKLVMLNINLQTPLCSLVCCSSVQSVRNTGMCNKLPTPNNSWFDIQLLNMRCDMSTPIQYIVGTLKLQSGAIHSAALPNHSRSSRGDQLYRWRPPAIARPGSAGTVMCHNISISSREDTIKSLQSMPKLMHCQLYPLRRN